MPAKLETPSAFTKPVEVKPEPKKIDPPAPFVKPVEVKYAAVIESKPPVAEEQKKKVSKLFADSDDEEEESAPIDAKKPEPVVVEETKKEVPKIVKAPKQETPVQKTSTMPRPSAIVQTSQESQDFKNSLASLLSKGNPLMPGVQRRPTIAPKRFEEEAAQKDKIKFDIFNDEEETPDYKKKTVLDNVSSCLKLNYCIG